MEDKVIKLSKSEHYKLTKEMLHAKFNGVCAFCGQGLGNKWCVWDIEPRSTVVSYRGDIILGNDSYENKLPACISCNSTRGHHSSDKNLKIDIEAFRKALMHDFWFLQEGVAKTYYNKAIRFGLIKETGNEITFHFEKHQNY